MRPNLTYRISAILFIIVTIAVISCKKGGKDIPPKKEEDNKEIDYTAENRNINPNISKAYINKQLKKNSNIELIAHVAYKSDTVAYYGSTNAQGRLNRLKAVVVIKSAAEAVVTEILDDDISTISYVVKNNVKSNYVIKTTKHNDTDQEVAILNYDWSKNTFTTITSGYYKNGLRVAAIKTTNESSSKCNASQSTDDDADNLQNEINRTNCNTNFWTKSVSEAITDGIKKAGDQLKESGALIISAISESEIVNKVIDALKFVANTPGILFDGFKSLIGKLVDQFYVLLKLDGTTNLALDEYLEKKFKVTFAVVGAGSGNAYKDKPIYVECALVDAATNTIINGLHQTGATSTTDGKVTFEFDPWKDELYKKSSLLLYYDYASNNLTKADNKTVSLTWIEPQISMVSGNGQTGAPGEKLPQPLKIRLTDQKNRPIKFLPKWTVTKGGGSVVFNEISDDEGYSSATWTIGKTGGDQEVKVEYLQRDKSPATGSPVVFTASKCTEPMTMSFMGLNNKNITGGPEQYTIKYNMDFKFADKCNILADAKSAYLLVTWSNGWDNYVAQHPTQHNLKDRAGQAEFTFTVGGEVVLTPKDDGYCCPTKYTYELFVDGKSIAKSGAMSPGL